MNLVKSTGTFSFFTIISRLLGYVRDILIAVFLGAGPLADAFFVAFRIPNTFRRLFSEGTFNAAFVPSYSSLLDNKKTSQKFANNIFNLLIVGLFFLVLIIEIMMPLFVFLIAPGFEGDYQKMELAITLTRITFPFLIFISLASFFSAILNTHNKFAIASATPIILNILLIGVLLFGKVLNDKLVYYLSYAVTASGVLQFIFLYFFVKKYFSPAIKFSFKIDDKIKIFFKKLLPSIFSSGVTQINILIGTIIASFQAGAVSYLYYADRIYQINLAIAGIAIGTVILPQLSKFVKSQKKEKINLIQNKALELSLFLSIPAAVALLIAPEEIISSLFGYGSFDELSVKNSAKALFYFAIGLPAFSLIKVFSAFFFARYNTKIPFYISFTSVFLNVFISVIFFKEIGFLIIPIATTISSWFNAILLFIFLKMRNFFSFNLVFIDRFIKIVLASVLMGILFQYVIYFFNDRFLYEASFKAIFLVGVVILVLIFYLLTAILIGAFKRSDINLNY
jgi:putative peptidoglycan lipid II flippase